MIAQTRPAPRLLWKRMVWLSLVLRLAVIALTFHHASANWFFLQASELGMLAESLRSGHGFSSPFGGATGSTAFLAPGYPTIIAAVFTIFHPFSLASAVAITILQACFATATAFLLMWAGRRAFDIRTANLAGAFWAISPALLWVPTIFWETSLSILLVTALLALALACRDTRSQVPWLLLGATAALALCVNSSLLTVIFCCFAWAVWQRRSRTLTPPAFGLGLFLLLSLLWPVRNLRVMHAWTPLRDNMGYELWQGNRPGADGFFLVDLHPNTSQTELHRWQELGELGYMREKSTLAKAAILADPNRFILLTGKRFLCFWTGVNRTSSPIAVLHISITTLFGFWGAFLILRRRVSAAVLFLLPLVLFPLPYYITHPDFRFRLVIDPILILLGSYALTQFAHRFRPRL